MHCLVTGAAGFIGSHLCERLLQLDHKVIAVDAFVPYYAQAIKERNLAEAAAHSNLRFCQLDLRQAPLNELVAEADVIFHLAAMPGLVRSWSDFDDYLSCNVQATQRLLEAIRQRGSRLQRFVYASTSSVYGRFSSGDESLPTKPISPYGVTKLAAEHLCRAYGEAYQIPFVILRYFSVYGPRQRPDMGYHKFITALLRREPIVVYGDGTQVRGNTYIDDCVAATVAAMKARSGEIYNVGGGETATLWQILAKLEALAGARAMVQHQPSRPGDQLQTFADTTKLRSHLDWEPKTTLDDGLGRQWQWQRQNLADMG